MIGCTSGLSSTSNRKCYTLSCFLGRLEHFQFIGLAVLLYLKKWEYAGHGSISYSLSCPKQKFSQKFYRDFSGISINSLLQGVYAKKIDLDIKGKIGIISTIGKVGEGRQERLTP